MPTSDRPLTGLRGIALFACLALLPVKTDAQTPQPLAPIGQITMPAQPLSARQKGMYMALEQELETCYAYYAVEDGCAKRLQDAAHQGDFHDDAQYALSELTALVRVLEQSPGDALKAIDSNIDGMTLQAGKLCNNIDYLYEKNEAECRKLVAAPDARIQEMQLFDTH